jgi:hypothetical protein
MTRTRILLIAALFVAACGDRAKQANADSDLARDLALANETQAYPQLRDTALSDAPQPTRATPAPQPRPRVTRTAATHVSHPVVVSTTPTNPPPAPAAAPARAAVRGFASGTVLALTTKSAICTTNLPGDKFIATLTAPVTGDDGAYLPIGTTVVLEVASVTPGDTPEAAQIALRVRSIMINDAPVSADADVAIVSPLERHEVPRDKNADRRRVVGGAVAGAILGQIMGKDTKSTVIGAAAGAAAGAGASAMTHKYDACLPAGGAVRATTSQQISVSD